MAEIRFHYMDQRRLWGKIIHWLPSGNRISQEVYGSGMAINGDKESFGFAPIHMLAPMDGIKGSYGFMLALGSGGDRAFNE